MSYRALTAEYGPSTATFSKHKKEHLDKVGTAHPVLADTPGAAQAELRKAFASGGPDPLDALNGAKILTFARNIGLHLMHLHSIGFDCALAADEIMRQAALVVSAEVNTAQGLETTTDKATVLKAQLDLIDQGSRIVERATKTLQGSVALEIYDRLVAKDPTKPDEGMSFVVQVEQQKEGDSDGQ